MNKVHGWWVPLLLFLLLYAGGCSSSQNPAAPSPDKTSSRSSSPQSSTADALPASPTPAAGTPGAAYPVPSATGMPGSAANATVGSAIRPTVVPSPTSQEPFFYLSYDGSASTAAVELSKYSLLQQGRLPDGNWARTWEFLNYERFTTSGQASTGLFNVAMGLWQHPDGSGQGGQRYELGVHVVAPAIEQAARRNLALTVVVDVSGSMSEPVPATADYKEPTDKLALAKLGLATLAKQLKAGDVVSLVKFSDSAATVLDHFAYDGSDLAPFLNAVHALQPENSTNLNAGIDEAYRVALAGYDPARINRVVLLTDAYANAGEIDPTRISSKVHINNAEGIYFSGLGFGADFNETFLNVLTEAGKGAYYSVVTPYDARRAFGERFMALVNVAARNIQFRLDFPADLSHQGSAAQQVSQNQSEVIPTNFAYNTAQFFLESFAPRTGNPGQEGQFKLTIAYTNPETGARVTEVYERSVAQILGQNVSAVKDAYAVSLLTGLMQGTKTAAVVQQELATSLADQQTTLTTEYRGLIQQWTSLAGSIPPAPGLIGPPLPAPLVPVPAPLPGQPGGGVCIQIYPPPPGCR